MFELTPWRRRERETWPARVPWDLPREFVDLINRFFGEGVSLPAFRREFSPAIDISETNSEFIVKGEIPDMDPQDLDISLTGDVLTIKGEKKEEKEEKGKDFRRVERTFGSFSRSFALPCEVQQEKIESTYKDGVISLRLPKAEGAKRKSIKIDVK